jgi:hypothetical protein
MIQNDGELQGTIERILHFRALVNHIREVMTTGGDHLSAGGFLAEVDRMQREVRDYLSLHPSEMEGAAKANPPS